MSLDKMRETLETRRRAYEDAKLAYLTALQQEQEKAMAGNGKSGLPERRRVARTDPGVRRKGGWPKGKPRGKSPKADTAATSAIQETGSIATTATTPKAKVGRPPKKKGRVPAKNHVWRKKGAVATKQPVPTEAELDEALEIVAGEGK